MLFVPSILNLKLRIAPDPGLGTVTRGVIRSKSVVIEGTVASTSAALPEVFCHSPSLGSHAIKLGPTTTPTRHFNFHKTVHLASDQYDLADLASLSVYIVRDDVAYRLQTDSENYYLDIGQVSKSEVYSRLSHRGTRIRDTETLVVYAIDALQRYYDDPATAAECLCTIGYRELETKQYSDQCEAIRRGPDIVAKFKDLNARQDYRWYVSANLMLAYFYIIRRELASAASSLSLIVEAAPNLRHTPQMITNTIKAFMLLGFVHRRLKPKETGCGQTAWEPALKWFQLAQGIWEFENHYSFGDLKLSIALLEQCNAALHLEAVAEGRRKDDPHQAPAGLQVDFDPLGFPAGEYRFRDFFNSPQVRIIA